jgi:hypothetical protein
MSCGFSSMGTRLRSLGWYRPWIRHLSLSMPAVPPRQHRRPRFKGAGTGEPPWSYGAVDRSIDPGVPFAKGAVIAERSALNAASQRRHPFRETGGGIIRSIANRWHLVWLPKSPAYQSGLKWGGGRNAEV